jgi:hypothetical protein
LPRTAKTCIALQEIRTHWVSLGVSKYVRRKLFMEIVAERGKILWNGLYTFRHRLSSLQSTQRRSSAPQLSGPASQPISPVTPTHPLQPVASGQPIIQARMASGNLMPTRVAKPPAPSLQARAHSISAGHMYPNQHPLSQKPQTGFVRPTQNINPAVQATRNQSMVQPAPSKHSRPGMQQAPSPAFKNESAPLSPAPAAQAITASPTPSMDTAPAEQEPWEVTWAELEALDRSEWDADTADDDDVANPANGNLPPDSNGYPTADAPPTSASVPPANVPTNMQLTHSTESFRPPTPTNLPAEQNITNHSPMSPIENTKAQVPSQEPAAPAQPSPTLPVVAKEEAQSPSELLRSPPFKPLTTRLERRISLLAADVIDIEELSDDDSSTSEPLMTSARGAPPAPRTSSEEVIDIEYSDEDEEMVPEPTQSQADPTGQPHHPATTPSPGSSRGTSDNHAPTVAIPHPSQPFEETQISAPAPIRGANPNAVSAAGHRPDNAQPIPTASTVLPSHKYRADSPEQVRPADNQVVSHPSDMLPIASPSSTMAPPGPITMQAGETNESQDMEIDELTEEGLMTPADTVSSSLHFWWLFTSHASSHLRRTLR